MRVTRRLVSIGAVLVVLAGARAADAAGGDAPTVEEIKAAEVDFNRGREAYKQGSYTEAAEYFESADQHAPNDRVLELAIGARDKAGALDRSATLAQLGLDRYPNSDRIKKVATPLVERARKELLIVVVECDEACNVLDGTRIVPGRPAMKRTLYLTPGDHSIRAVWSEDRGVTQSVGGKVGETVSVAFKAPPIPKKEEAPLPATPAQEEKKPAAEEAPPTGLPPIYFFIGAGATAVLGGVTAWSGIDTVKNPGTDVVEKKCVGQGESCPEYKDGRSRQLRTNILIGATSVVGVATAVVGVFFTNWRGNGKSDVEADQAGKVRPFVGYSNGPSIGAMGRF